MPVVNPPGTRRLDVTCDTYGRVAGDAQFGVLTATVFGQSMHLLVDEGSSARRSTKLRGVGIPVLRSTIGPSLEDVFVALTAKQRMRINRSKPL